jgi:oligoribonuclease (3'-5' exoribonuclease)
VELLIEVTMKMTLADLNVIRTALRVAAHQGDTDAAMLAQAVSTAYERAR